MYLLHFCLNLRVTSIMNMDGKTSRLLLICLERYIFLLRQCNMLLFSTLGLYCTHEKTIGWIRCNHQFSIPIMSMKRKTLKEHLYIVEHNHFSILGDIGMSPHRQRLFTNGFTKPCFKKKSINFHGLG